MATRSRRGCIDCKRAKVKCDELHPSCGTCSRRGRECSGYDLTHKTKASQRRESLHGGIRSKTMASSSPPESRLQRRRASSSTGCSIQTISSLHQDASPPHENLAEQKISSTTDANSGCGMTAYPSIDACANDSVTSTTDCATDCVRTMILEASVRSTCPSRGPTFIPLDDILITEKPFIEVYFMRHPSEMVMCNDNFIQEMNQAVIMLLQENPVAVSDSLSAIGETYLMPATNSALVSNRKIRLMGRLQKTREDGSSPEVVLLVLLALCGIELVDPRSDSEGKTISALIDTISMILSIYASLGKELSPVAKYFIRAVARQDLMISLCSMQRTKISPSIWLDEYSMCHADRLMGLTTTLAPILSDLTALAEDVQRVMDDHQAMMYLAEGLSWSPPDVLCNSVMQHTEIASRARYIKAALTAWRPIRDNSISMEQSRKFYSHAYAWRSAALLYLFRLFNRPGSSADTDEEALGMAYEVLVHITGSPQDIKLSLWPLFLAACELERQEDRDHANRLFDDIHHARPVVTVPRTKSFCINQIWLAKDLGQTWDWMQLVRTGSHILIPL